MDITLTIEFLSKEWIRNIAITISIMLLYFLFASKTKDKDLTLFMKISSLLVFAMTLSNHIILAIDESWTLRHDLPMHLCSVSALICCVIAFIKKNQFLFEFLFYAGIIGGLLSLSTPQIILYNEYYFFYIMFYFKHAAIIAIPLVMRYRMKMNLSKKSWLKVFGAINLLFAIVIPINASVGSNYLYVSTPPQVNNPFIIEDLDKVFGLPTYVFYWEIIMIIFLLLLYFIFKKPK